MNWYATSHILAAYQTHGHQGSVHEGIVIRGHGFCPKKSAGIPMLPPPPRGGAPTAHLAQVMTHACEGPGVFFGCIAPRLQPRFYSLSSGPGPNPKSLHVTCAVVNDTTPTGRSHKGVGSCWLAGRSAGDKLPSFVRRSTFHLPRHLDVPIVMIGPGTGLAPFRGFLQQRAWLQQKSGQSHCDNSEQWPEAWHARAGCFFSPLKETCSQHSLSICQIRSVTLRVAVAGGQMHQTSLCAHVRPHTM